MKHCKVAFFWNGLKFLEMIGLRNGVRARGERNETSVERHGFLFTPDRSWVVILSLREYGVHVEKRLVFKSEGVVGLNACVFGWFGGMC